MYAKLIDGNLEFAPQNKGAVINYNVNVELMVADGYKLFVEVPKPTTNRKYHISYKETATEIQETIVYDETQKQADAREAKERESEFNVQFFNTSLGYIRRSVTMADGSKKDFLSDLMPTIKMGLESGIAVNILAYDKPPFDKEVEDWTEYQKQVVVTPQFIQECFMQLSNDFLPINEE